jgi:RNA 2',3'-cyclic 3'-phosphodiesterase
MTDPGKPKTARAQRLFVGIPLPSDYQETLAALQDKWKPALRSRISWTRPGNWHLTLQFLGEVEEETAGAVHETLVNIRFFAFPFRAGGGGYFPSQRRPKVAWIGVGEGRERCIGLAGAVAAALRPLGFAPDRERFSPHLTIARIREDRGDPWAEFRAELDGLEFPAVVIDRFILWRSDLSPQGPAYTAVGRYPLD